MRGKKAPKRDLKPDEIYNSVIVTKFINYLMMDGKKAVARKVMYEALEELGEKTKTAPVAALEQAISNVKPRIEVRSRRVGGSNYQVPTPVADQRQLALTLRWIITSARKARKNTKFSTVLARELLDAFNGEGNAVRKKDEVKRMAEANRAFAHFAF